MKVNMKVFVHDVPSDWYTLDVEEILEVRKTKKGQEALFLKCKGMGKVLIIDGQEQATELYQEEYHLALVKNNPLAKKIPANDRRRALMLGGGQGVGTRMLLEEHYDRVDVVDFDKEIIDMCVRNVPHLSKGAFSDPRVKIHYRDFMEYLKSCKQKYDYILWDITSDFIRKNRSTKNTIINAMRNLLRDKEKGAISIQFGSYFEPGIIEEAKEMGKYLYDSTHCFDKVSRWVFVYGR